MTLPPHDTDAFFATAAARSGPAGQVLHLDLTLHRARPQAPWSAEISLPGEPPPLSFAGLPELISFLARLDPPAAARGLR